MISVCAPYYQRQEALDGMVAQYDALYPEMDIELCIADDGSRTPVMIPLGKHPAHVAYLPRKDHPLNPCVPINRAVSMGSGDIIVLTNPEVRHQGRVLDHLVVKLILATVTHKRAYVTARAAGIGYGGPEPFWLAGPEVDYTKHGRLPVPPGAHFHFLAAFWRDLWEEVGGFDEDYRHVQACDDNDWLWRCAEAGAEFHTVDGIVTQPKSSTKWGMPHGRTLFNKKWPLRRMAKVLKG
jgi:hypothetical protein